MPEEKDPMQIDRQTDTCKSSDAGKNRTQATSNANNGMDATAAGTPARA
jgi:hypothetical protein